MTTNPAAFLDRGGDNPGFPFFHDPKDGVWL
jgi:hypothetical protein